MNLRRTQLDGKVVQISAADFSRIGTAPPAWDEEEAPRERDRSMDMVGIVLVTLIVVVGFAGGWLARGLVR